MYCVCGQKMNAGHFSDSIKRKRGQETTKNMRIEPKYTNGSSSP